MSKKKPKPQRAPGWEDGIPGYVPKPQPKKPATFGPKKGK
jgi:hypothetical protein